MQKKKTVSPVAPFQGNKIAIVGCGTIGEALARGMLAAGFAQPAQIQASTRSAERARALGRKLGIVAGNDNRRVVEGADVVVLAVKPPLAMPILDEIAGELHHARTMVISVAAAIGTVQLEQAIERRAGGFGAVIRAMPNMPALIGQGMTALALGRKVSAAQAELARQLFLSIGRTVIVEERYMDAVTGLSASGPAFIYMVIESLAEGGVRVGLPREMALELAAQTVVGAGAMVLETQEHPAKLKDAVTTPAGCTVDGLLELEEGGLRVALIKAVSRAALRAGQLVSR